MSVPVELHFTLSKVEDNRIKEVTVQVIDAGEDTVAVAKDSFADNKE